MMRFIFDKPTPTEIYTRNINQEMPIKNKQNGKKRRAVTKRERDRDRERERQRERERERERKRERGRGRERNAHTYSVCVCVCVRARARVCACGRAAFSKLLSGLFGNSGNQHISTFDEVCL